MTEKKLEQGKLLLKNIKSIREQLPSLINLRDKPLNVNKKKKDNPMDDGLYGLYIGEYSDLSGRSAKLERYGGNLEVLEAIITTLQDQLKRYEEEFKNL